MACIAFDHFESLLQQLRRAIHFGAENCCPTEDGIEWRTQLVRKSGEKLILHLTNALGFGTGRRLTFEQFFTIAQNAFDAGNIPRNLRNADDVASWTFDWRNRDRYI